MLNYIFKRVLHGIPVIFGVITISFFLMYIAPGDPVLAIVGEYYNEETLQELREDLNLDDSILYQYGCFLGRILRGDFGTSYITERPILDDLLTKAPYTFSLALVAIIIAVIGGVFLGIISAIKRNSIWDKLAVLLSVVGISAPVFWVALILILFFSIELQLLPPSGYGQWYFIILPAIALGTRSFALFTRITRTNFIEIIAEDYMITAKAKGLSNYVVILKHGLKNLMIPLITVIGLDFSSYLTGAVLTESIFGWPGLGRYMLDSIIQRDFPAIQGTVLFMALIFVGVNIIVDVLYSVVSPQTRETIFNE